ncbi:hypothetical protein lbkm_0709 [Lachnospiraceae bacterium KM106-2]|nr:hypothetical protein lbkm_0709 [Lachnospiraceae bacterium KM106-2]
MSSESEKTVQGFLFETQSDYENAKKEYEVVTYLKANTDFSNVKVIYKLYEKLLEKDTFQTVIGYKFLSEIREQILESNEEFERILKPVPVKKSNVVSKKKKKKRVNPEVEGKYKLLYENMKEKRTRTKIVNFFLIGIILAMIVITFTSNHASTEKLETALQNKYSTWQDELNQKEKQLDQREAQLNKQSSEKN